MNEPRVEPLPNDLPRPADELAALEAAWAPPAGWRRIFAVNNSHIGLWYIATALLFFVLAGVLALVMRVQLAVPDNALVGPALYNQLFTMHGTVMMFLFAVPVVEAVAVYLLPAMLGARDLPFPRLSAYAFWTYAFGGLAFFGTLFFGVAPDGGWTLYPPLSGKQYSPGSGADWWLLGIGFIEISAIAGAIELIVGIVFTRAPGMTWRRLPVFAWAMLIASLMVVLAFPAIIAGTLLLEIERAFDWPLFIAARGGDPLLWQHLFWFFGHPEVYIIFLPAAGLVSTLLPVLVGARLVGRRAIVLALAAVGGLSFLLWVHHMFTAGTGRWAQLVASAASLAVALPSTVQVFAWIATIAQGKRRSERRAPTVPLLFIVGFLVTFVIGGLTGVLVAVLPFDLQAHDTYFVVAHLHYVLIGGMVFPLFAALYFWAPLVNGRRLSERLGRWVFALMFGGFHLAFFPMHVSGLLGMPRRVQSYGAGLGLEQWNALSTAGAFAFAAGVALCLADLVRTLRRPERPHGDPWHAATLEWLPQGEHGQRSIAEVRTAEPLWDRPGLAREVEAGAHWLPGTVFGGRETLVTGFLDARPKQLLRLPGDGWEPLVAALGTAGFFLLLTGGQVLLAALAGVVAVTAMLRWLWAADRPAPRLMAAIGRDRAVPTVLPRLRSHSFWALVALLVVEASIFASFAFVHLHVTMALEVCPPPGARLPPLEVSLTSTALLLLGALALLPAARRGSATWLGLAFVATVAGHGVEALGYRHAGLAPTAQAWSASIAALGLWQGLHLALLAVLAPYLMLRARRRLVRPAARATLDLGLLLWTYVIAQGLTALWLVRLLAT